LLEVLALEPLVQHVVSKVAAMPTVEEDLDRFERLPCSGGDGGHGDRPGGFGLCPEGAGEAPTLVFAGGDAVGFHDSLLVGGGDNCIVALHPTEAKRNSDILWG
jgi:hypothetical protein